MFDFSHKTYVVTGGGTGIGRSIAELLLQSGANVVISSRRKATLEKAASEINTTKLAIYTADLSQENEIKRLVEFTCSKFGGLNGYINNSGSWTCCPVEELDTQKIVELVNSNMMSVMLGTRYAANAMSEGSIVNISSYAALHPMPFGSIYASTKAAILTFTQSAAAELAEKNIRVNCVIPGVIETDMTRDYINANKEKLLKPIALKRIGTPEDVARGALFLCSTHASYITGTSLEITGGKFITQ